MDEQMVRAFKGGEWMRATATAALGVLALFLLVATFAGLKYLKYIGSGVAATNTITVSGEAEVFAVPDTAVFSVTVRETAREVKTAQDAATKEGNDIVSYLKEKGVEEKDIKTTEYSVYPQYEWIAPGCDNRIVPCPGSKQTLTGFQVSQTLTVKVRDTQEAGDLLEGVGSRGASEVSGLSFTIDDEDALKAEARDEAIQKAKEKAEVLADSLGVKLVRVVGFYENDGPTAYPYGMGGAERSVAQDAKLAAPVVPTGENKIVSSVSVTYEVR